jgi:CHAD domain-containing protein
MAHGGALEPAALKKLSRRAKKVTRLPAEVRDLDVALDNVAMLRDEVESTPERKAAKEMRRRLKKKRRSTDRKVRQQLERDRPVRKLARRLKKALARGSADGRDLKGSPVVGVRARDVLNHRDAIGDWDDDQALHALRISVKKLRGTLQARGDGQRRTMRPLLSTLQDVQTLLGEHHDWSELGDRLDLRRCKLLAAGARHRGLIGYELLLSRAREEQKARYDAYRAHLHDRLGTLVAALLPEGTPVLVEAPPVPRALETPASLSLH